MIPWHSPCKDPGGKMVRCLILIFHENIGVKIIERAWEPQVKCWVNHSVGGQEYFFGNKMVKAWAYIDELPLPPWFQVRQEEMIKKNSERFEAYLRGD